MMLSKRAARLKEKERLQAAAMSTAAIRARVAALSSQVHRDLRRLETVLSDVFQEPQPAEEVDRVGH